MVRKQAEEQAALLSESKKTSEEKKTRTYSASVLADVSNSPHPVFN